MSPFTLNQHVWPVEDETSLIILSVISLPPSCRKQQCNNLLENLKKFQSCRSHLTNTIQRAEQAISDQASYMGKDNLQRSITKVSS